MPGTLPHMQDGFAQTAAADQQIRKEVTDGEASVNEDPTTLKFNGKVAISDDEGMDARGRATQGAVADDAGGDPYNRTGRFRRVVR